MPDPTGSRRIFDRLSGGGYGLTLMDDGVRVEVRYLRREHHTLVGEVEVLCEWYGARTYHNTGSLSCADLNLSSQTARVARGKHCAERAKSLPTAFDWPGLIDDVCRQVIESEREGDAFVVLDDAPERELRDINVHGIQLPADAASLLIAHGDSLKSLVALLALGTLAREGHPVLYVDWEWSADRHRARKRRLFGPERLEHLHYLRCHAPLIVESDRLRRFCDMKAVEFLVIDSVGLACDGKLIDDDVAIRFHRVLGQLPPAICAAHVPKSALHPDAKADPQAFGSVYFGNLARMSWVVKKQPGVNDDLVTVGLFPSKQNHGARLKPVGLEFTFTPDRIHVRQIDLAMVEGLSDKLPLAQRMVGVLGAGAKTMAGLAEELAVPLNHIVQTVKRHDGRTFQRLTGTDGIVRIGLAAKVTRVT